MGILDAPHLRNNPFARGMDSTRMIDGACVSVDEAGRSLAEAKRIRKLSKEVKQ
jgi:hypothetical protein